MAVFDVGEGDAGRTVAGVAEIKIVAGEINRIAVEVVGDAQAIVADELRQDPGDASRPVTFVRPAGEPGPFGRDQWGEGDRYSAPLRKDKTMNLLGIKTIGALAMALSLLAAAPASAHQSPNGINNGINNGLNNGLGNGVMNGLNNGLNNGVNNGYNNGTINGVSAGSSPQRDGHAIRIIGFEFPSQ